MKKIAFVTLFPDWIRSSLSHSIMARAEASGAVEFSVVNPRNFCYDQHRKVDDIPYGGHPGMLLKAEPVALAIESVIRAQGTGLRQSSVSSWQSAGEESAKGFGSSEREPSPGSHGFASSPVSPKEEASSLGSNSESVTDAIFVDTKEREGFEPSIHNNDPHPVRKLTELSEGSGISLDVNSNSDNEIRSSNLLLSSKTAIVITEPSGVKFEQPQAEELASYDQVIFVCGHYEGIDHRVEETFATHVFSIGDYVLTNGELPAMVMADAVVRLLPGVLGNQNSLEEESFQNNLLGAPNYTRPEVWRGKPIPDVLKSGNHAMIDKWRLEQAKERTKVRRPDLLDE